MKQIFLILLVLCWLRPVVAANQNMTLIEQQAHRFIRSELAQRPQATFQLGKLDRRLAVPACPEPKVAWADGAVPNGQTFLDLYCLSPAWRLRLPVVISELVSGLVLTRPVHAGEVLGADDVRQAPLADPAMARDILSDPAQAVGQSMTSGAAAGIWLRRFMVRPPVLVKTNQRVKVSVGGEGFRAEAEGVAIGSARAGEVVPVRMPNGQLVRGVVGQDGGVSLNN